MHLNGRKPRNAAETRSRSATRVDVRSRDSRFNMNLVAQKARREMRKSRRNERCLGGPVRVNIRIWGRLKCGICSYMTRRASTENYRLLLLLIHSAHTHTLSNINVWLFIVRLSMLLTLNILKLVNELCFNCNKSRCYDGILI